MAEPVSSVKKAQLNKVPTGAPKMLFIYIKGNNMIIHETTPHGGITKLKDFLCTRYGVVLDKRSESMCG